ncbi:hypothetical protein [Nocardioides sp. NPDC006273]|uniref:hypothetical protein n=1 Tax=Nocardioides sp. NPDC006273 TaxID=3155598 RepID=UPI0033B71C14
MARSHADLASQLDDPPPLHAVTDLAEDQAETKPAAKKTTTKRAATKKSAPAKKAAAKRTTTAKKTAATKPAAEPKPEAEPIRVLIPGSDDSKAVSLYLHMDDFKALGLAKLEDGIQLNDRVRAMIALYRGNQRVRAQVDKLAKTAKGTTKRG